MNLTEEEKKLLIKSVRRLALLKKDYEGDLVYLSDIWVTKDDVTAMIEKHLSILGVRKWLVQKRINIEELKNGKTLEYI